MRPHHALNRSAHLLPPRSPTPRYDNGVPHFAATNELHTLRGLAPSSSSTTAPVAPAADCTLIWEFVRQSGALPSARAFHAAARLGDGLIVFGARAPRICDGDVTDVTFRRYI